ncbi:HNH endonuclease family protein [Pseudomonas sp. KCA11]|nr:HNH endonuclease family protein [Pseudomonas sp. KCA11]
MRRARSTIPISVDKDHILPRSWNVPLAAERWQRGRVAAYSDGSDIEFIVRSCGTLTPWQLLIRERQESIPMLGNLTLLNLSVTRTAQHCDFAAKPDKLMPMPALVSMSH